ncbi:phage tail terminator family protein [Zhenpiania hominis]|uniref:Uncharacterized protein n=1 Tax=Zhenpiania hominis TaxID=2763644 RepID=A0A923NMJ7_9FIRM|nr:hypothetical protein [Zhenpiania hominis]MBC6681309.1 hypothetical protein [Zhenpiania hominis]
MINKLTNGIAAAIHAEFGDAYEIYIENVEQGLTEPCFLITLVHASMEQQLNETYEFDHLFLVQYFPSTQEARNECMEVQFQLYQALEYIEADDRLRRGEEMEGEIVDDVLQFQVRYRLLLRKQQAKEYMELLKMQIDARG